MQFEQDTARLFGARHVEEQLARGDGAKVDQGDGHQVLADAAPEAADASAGGQLAHGNE